ncbi:hypothetical protein NHX12_025580 [Muraenolepis orangiensis]|uniref:Uncharacterized protein n=1 Tax=Muraenolepis orangiensis TaxID=630683 RepID=A0A9Q0ISE4_9TELE|nr:hypothetical protein NHX12_025580 [Muraenolepis orangiensis]
MSDSPSITAKAVIQLTTKTQPVEASDDAFWDQFWADTAITVQDAFALVPAAEIRAVREESPSNLATLCYKAVEKLVQGADSGCPSDKERQIALNCTRLLTRILPYIFEDADWRGFFWSNVPGAGRAGRLDLGDDSDDTRPLAESLLLAIADLLFCPDFTVHSHKKDPDSAENMQSMDSCEYIWEAGVGFAQSPPFNYLHDLNRMELLKLLLTCFSEAMYLSPSSSDTKNPWVSFFCSTDNRHVLPLFTSLLNVVCAYDPVGYGIPYNHLLFSDQREQLVELAMQILVVTLEHEVDSSDRATLESLETPAPEDQEPTGPDNLFVNYLSRIHREEDFGFILRGLAKLLNNPLAQTYLPNSTKRIHFHQELLILFWKLCDFNKKFLFFVLKSSDVLDVLIPILFYLNDARADQSCLGLMHIAVFILLLLSGERNFGVRLNKPYTVRVPMDIPVFTGSHADLLIVIFHKIITISPYLKSLSMVAANKLLHLLEAFSTSWYLFSSAQNHHLVFFLLEVFNNIIQYQFDGNFNLVYAIIRKRSIFHQLANLPTDMPSIQKPGTLKASLQATPAIDKLTEQSQVSVDGTMVALKQRSSTQTAAAANASDTESNSEHETEVSHTDSVRSRLSSTSSSTLMWRPTPNWVVLWKSKLPLQTIMGLTDESEILKFLQHGTLVGLLPVPHPILIRKYQANAGTTMWFRTYMWGVIYLRNVDPPVWYDTDVRLFEIQRI